MSITRAKQSSFRTGVVKYDNFLGGLPYTPTIGTATDGGTGLTATVAFTGNNTAGLTYTALSTPGSLTGTSLTSPITVSGLTSGTAYTFQVKATNSAGDSAYSAASNSVTPLTPSSFESIATATPTSGSSVSFTSIPSTYKSLQLRMFSVGTGSNYLNLRFNNDSAANYANHYLVGTGSATSANGSTSDTYLLNMGYQGVSSTTGGTAIVDIVDYASTTKNKTARSLMGFDANGSGLMFLTSGLWLSTTAINRIDVISNGGTAFASGTTISLYGIKG